MNEAITVPDHIAPDTPFVQILDPATGTGTFLVEVIDLIHKRMVERWKAQGMREAEIMAAWNTYVPEHLLPRLTGFEIMMAPYAIAQMKIGLKLAETGYTFGSDERARVFLTNALEPAKELDLADLASFEALSHEADAANEAKRKSSTTVVLGNPPYAGTSSNLTPQAREIVQRYKSIGGEKIVERGALQFEKNLQDDYVKFFAWSEEESLATGLGVLALITNNGFLDTPTLRGMRWSLLNNFPINYSLNLNGSIKIPVPGDENVFDIQQGVAISFLARSCNRKSNPICNRYSLAGGRKDKYDFLLEKSIGTVDWQEINPIGPLFQFIPLDSQLLREFSDFVSLTKLMPFYSSGTETGFDALMVDFTKQELSEKLQRFLSLNKSENEIEKEFSIGGGTGRKLLRLREEFRTDFERNSEQRFLKGMYRVFDGRIYYFKKSYLKTNSFKVMQNLSMKGNIALVAFRQQSQDGFQHAFVTDKLGDKNAVSLRTREINYYFPLQILPSTNSLDLEAHSKANFAKSILRDFADKVSLSFAEQNQENHTDDLTQTFGPRDLFDWIYAVLHSPGYRSRYAEFLKSDFPRIPMPRDRVVFAALVPLGRELVALHLLRPDEAPALENPEIRLAGTGEARVEKGYPKYENGKVMINADRWFEDVPRATWEFYVGGYQVLHKWLKDRAAKGGKKPSPGRVLTEEDLLHYRRVVVALTETIRLMAEIDTVIDAQGGFPDAFYQPPPPPPTIEEIIEADEGQDLEFKSTLQWDLREGMRSKFVRKASMKSIVAFLNSGGGSLVLGVRDDKEILGLEADFALTRNEREWFEQTLVNFINRQIGPEFAPSYRIRFYESKGHQICVVVVLERAPKPAYLKDGDASEFYVRTSNKTVPLKGDELQTYVEMHWRK